MEPWLVELIDSADVARFATTDGIQPHLVPVVLVSEGNHIYLPIDGKLKKPGRLKRMSNIELHPEVALLVDHCVDRSIAHRCSKQVHRKVLGLWPHRDWYRIDQARGG